MTQTDARIGVVGSGYVGTVLAAGLAGCGYTVVGLEIDPDRLACLVGGRAPFHEEGLDDLIAGGVAAGTLSFTGDAETMVTATDIVFLCVGTPPGPDGRSDMTYVEDAVRAVAAHATDRHVLVTKSTVPVGTGRWIAGITEEVRGAPLAVVSNPEFLREGCAVEDFYWPDRIVVGGDDQEAVERVAAVYRPIVEQSFPGGRREVRPVMLRTTLTTAETIKYAANAFLAGKVSFINEIARICDLVGADVTGVAEGIGLDARINPRFLQAGLGWGGSCFGKDLSALIATAADYGYDAPLLRAIVDVNTRQRDLVVEKLQRHVRPLRGARITVLGLAFKPGTDDLRDSPALELGGRLRGLGATVSVYDPVIESVTSAPWLKVMRDAYAAATGADAVVIATEWPEFVDIDLQRLASVVRGRVLVDARNCLEPAAVADAGFVYEGVGRPSVGALAPAPRLSVVAQRRGGVGIDLNRAAG